MPGVLFLDLDGVLNSTAWVEAQGAGPRAEWWVLRLDPAAVAVLNRIIVAARPRVVLSSSWRRLQPLREIQSRLEQAGFIGQLMGQTPEIRYADRWAVRGEEIQAWLDDQAEPGPVAILDDDADMAQLSDRLVQTDPDRGLGLEHVAPVLALLGRA